MRGILTVRARDAVSRRLVVQHTVKNMIVNRGFGALVLLLGQTTETGTDMDPLIVTPDSLRVHRLQVGDSGGSPAVPPALTQTGLLDPTPVELLPVIETFMTTSPYEIVARVTLESVTPANGKTLREAGLFTKGIVPTPAPPVNPESLPRLVARQIHPEIAKTEALVVEYEWHIAVSA